MNIPENFDRWMFDYTEGNLSAAEEAEFEQFLLNNPDFESDADAWNAAKVSPEMVTYHGQEQLMRKNRFVGWYAWSAAALFLLLLSGLGVYLAQPSNPEIAAINNKPVSNVDREIANHTSSESQTRNTTTTSNNTQNNSQTNNQTWSSNEEYSAQLNEENYENEALAQLFSTNATNASEDNSYADQITEERQINDELIVDNEFESVTTKKGAHANRALEQAKSKLTASADQGKYAKNPTSSSVELNLNKKNKIQLNSLENKMKRLYRKLERSLDYPIGLVNLRDPNLVLPENSLTAFNPAFTGGLLKSRFEMSYRNQWLGSELNGHITRIAFDNYLYQLKGGLGVAFNGATNNSGGFSDYSFDFTFSPKMTISKNMVFEPAVKVTVGAMSANPGLLGDQKYGLKRGLPLAPVQTPITNSQYQLWYQDYGLGFVLNAKWFYAGFSADNLNRHYGNVFSAEGEATPERTPILYQGIIGTDYESANKNMTFSPFAAYRQFGDDNELWAGMNYRLNNLLVGGSYSTNQEFTVSIGMKFKKFKMMYQYDHTKFETTAVKPYGSHTIGIRFNGELKNARFKY